MHNFLAISAIIEEDVSIGDGTKIYYFSHIREHVKIGRDCKIGDHVYIGEKVIIGDDVTIGNDVNIPEGVIIKDRVRILWGTNFTNVRKPHPTKKAKKYLDTIIEEDVSIGANCTIVGGVRIGKGAKIGDGAIVISDIEDGMFAAGNPARIIKKSNIL